MVESKSKGSVRLNKEDMKAWEERLKEAERRQQERRRRASRGNSSATASP